MVEVVHQREGKHLEDYNVVKVFVTYQGMDQMLGFSAPRPDENPTPVFNCGDGFLCRDSFFFVADVACHVF